MNLMMLLEMAASGFGDRVAVTNGAVSLTYQQLFDAAGSAALGRAPIDDAKRSANVQFAIDRVCGGAAWAN